MSVELRIGADALDVHVHGADRIWGFRRHLEIPLGRIVDARVVPARDAKRDLKLRTAGLGVPGLAAVGYFRGRQAKRQWWRVYRAARVLVVDLAPASALDRVVLEIEDPDAQAAAVNQASHRARGGRGTAPGDAG